MIIEVNNRQAIPMIVSMAKNIKSWTYNLEKMAAFLLRTIPNPDMKIVMDTEMKALAIASIEIPKFPLKDGEKHIFIDIVWVDPAFPEITKELINMVRKWGKEIGVPKIYTIINRGERVFIKKHGFKREGILISREV